MGFKKLFFQTILILREMISSLRHIFSLFCSKKNFRGKIISDRKEDFFKSFFPFYRFFFLLKIQVLQCKKLSNERALSILNWTQIMKQNNSWIKNLRCTKLSIVCFQNKIPENRADNKLFLKTKFTLQQRDARLKNK